MGTRDKTLKLATRKADICLSRMGVSKAYGGRQALIEAFMPVAEMEVMIGRHGKRMGKVLAANGEKIDKLRASFEQPPPPAFDPAELEKKVDGMVARGVNGFSFSDPPVPQWHPEALCRDGTVTLSGTVRAAGKQIHMVTHIHQLISLPVCGSFCGTGQHRKLNGSGMTLFEKRKKNRKKKTTGITPLHDQAEGSMEVAQADSVKANLRDYSVYRDGDRSHSRFLNQVAVDHPVTSSDVPGAPDGMVHLDLQPSVNSANAAAFSLTNNGAGPGDQFRYPVTVPLAQYDSAHAAGSPDFGDAQPTGNPNRTPNAPDGGWGRDATGSNAIPTEQTASRPERARDTASPEGHSRNGVTSTSPVSAKNADILQAAYREAGVRTLDYRGR